MVTESVKHTLYAETPIDFATEHDGGTFLKTWDEAGRPVPHELGRGDAIVFNSDKVHNVSPITRGVRVALVLELWLAGPNVHDRNG